MLGRYDISNEYIQKSQSIFLQMGDLDALAVSYTHTAEAFMHSGENSTALQYLVRLPPHPGLPADPLVTKLAKCNDCGVSTGFCGIAGKAHPVSSVRETL